MICEVCGCTDERACIDLQTGEPCHWTEPNLCSCCDGLGGPGLAIRTWPLPEYSPENALPASAAKDDHWYCGDPTCTFCLEEGRVPLSEIRRQ